VISPYAKRGYIDHQTLSFDAYVKFIEDDFLSGQRLDPQTDGRPDPRPDVRENAAILGNLTADFDFLQKPRAPLILSEYPVAVASAPATGKLIMGTITALSADSITIQVTGTGAHDTNLQGQTLVIAITPTTTILIDNQPGQAANLQIGEAASLHIQGSAGSFDANQISAQTP
jgi:hypothetical protein